MTRRGPETPCGDAAERQNRVVDRPSEPKSKPARTGEDVVLVHSKVEDGEGWRVLRAREGRVEAGVIRTAEEGKPIHGELVRLAPRPGVPEGAPIFDAEVQYAAPAAGRGRPAQVATTAYRDHWDEIFGARERPDAAPN